MGDIKVSIIVPVYNVGKYLSECMDSLINQSLKDIEIICVNDGSTDNSLEILEEYAKKDSRVKVLSIENSGVSIARNYGIQYARGKYIGFVDSDDYVDELMYEKLYISCEQNNLDLAICKISLFDDETREINNEMDYYNLNVFTGFDKKIFNSDDTKPFTFNINIYAYNKLYKRTLLTDNSIEFPPNIIFEDEVFFIKTYMYAKRISIINEFLYYYRINREGSLTYLDKENNYVDIVDVYKRERDIFKQINKYEEYKLLLANRMIFLILVRFSQTSPRYKENFYNVLKEDLNEVLEDKDIRDNLSLNVKKRVFKIIESENYEEFHELDQNKMFSIILICHDAASYLEAGINSLLNQYFSFESNMQLILIDNGSDDNTETICNKYQKLYPHNIVFIHKQDKMKKEILIDEAKEYVNSDYTIILDEPYIFKRDFLSSLAIKQDLRSDEEVVLKIQHFDNLEKSTFNYHFRDLDSSGDNSY